MKIDQPSFLHKIALRGDKSLQFAITRFTGAARFGHYARDGYHDIAPAVVRVTGLFETERRKVDNALRVIRNEPSRTGDEQERYRGELKDCENVAHREVDRHVGLLYDSYREAPDKQELYSGDEVLDVLPCELATNVVTICREADGHIDDSANELNQVLSELFKVA